MKIVIVCLSVLLISCSDDDKKLEEVEVGKVLNAKETPTSFNDSRRTRIETTGGVFMVRGVVSVIKGEAVRVDTYDSGRKYLCFESKKYCPRILGAN